MFKHYINPGMHYQAYLEQVTQLNHPTEDPVEHLRSLKAHRGPVPKNSLLEYDQDLNMHSSPEIEPELPELNSAHFPPEVISELKVLVDPRNRARLFESPDDPKAAAKRRAITRRAYGKTAGVSGSKHRASTAPWTPLPPDTTSYAEIKSRYMLPVKRLEKVKTPESDLDTPRNQFPMPVDGIYSLPSTPSFRKKEKFVFKQLKPKEAKLVLGEADSVGKENPYLVEVRQTSRTNKKAQLSARLEFLSQPKPRKKAGAVYRKPINRTSTGGATVRQKNGANPLTPRLLVLAGRNASSLTRTSLTRIAKKKKSGKKRRARKVKNVLSAFGFEFKVPAKTSETKLSKTTTQTIPGKKVVPTDTAREKYRKSVLKMLEKASKKSKQKKESERMEQLQRGIAAMAIEAAAKARAADVVATAHYAEVAVKNSVVAAAAKVFKVAQETAKLAEYIPPALPYNKY